MNKYQERKNKAEAKLIRDLSKKSGFSEAFIHMAFQLGIYGAYDVFNVRKPKKASTDH